MALSQDTIAVLNEYQISGDYVHYYQTLNDAGELYGAYGLGASTDGHSLASGGYIATDFAGVLANTFLENKYFEVTGNVLTEAQKQSVRENLIKADYDIRVAHEGVVTGTEIAIYHGIVFEQLGIPKEAWTATALQDVFGPPAWCYGCSPEVLQNQTIFDVLTQLNTTVEAMKLYTFAGDLFGTTPNGSDGVFYKAFAEYVPTLMDVFKEHIQLVDHELSISNTINNIFTSAQTYVAPPPPRRRDPLVLDLDGNGIQTSGINTASPILFDHNADGVKTATGWVSANDGLLVWDRNGNGMIDNGRELFGDSTIKSDGTLATSGFNALADLDANHDGIVNSQDVNFANLKVWRDLNQDGISQSNELFTLDTYQITGINLANTTVNTAQSNGNTFNETGSYIRNDGTTALAGDVNLANNAFYSQFTDALPLSAAIQVLPDMHGAGMVRSLRDAASRSPQLAATLSQYAAATSDIQKAMLDNVFSQWLATSTFTTTADCAAAMIGGISHTTITLEGIAAGTPAYTAFMDKLNLVEKFNGRTFQPLPTDPTATLSYTILSAQQALIDQSYQALKNSVYETLLVQTRFKPYLNALTLSISADGITVDTSGINIALDTLSLTDAKGALLDLLELDRVQGQKLKSLGWTGIDTDRLTAYVEKVSLDPQLQTVLNDFHIRIGSGTVTAMVGDSYVFGQSGNDVLNGTGVNDILSGGAGDDTINSGGGNDTIYGGDGNDTITFGYNTSNTLDGGTGNDLIQSNNVPNSNSNYANTFTGGAGNDRMVSGGSADTYLFNRGDGQDAINDYGYNSIGLAVGLDKLVFGAGITRERPARQPGGQQPGAQDQRSKQRLGGGPDHHRRLVLEQPQSDRDRPVCRRQQPECGSAWRTGQQALRHRRGGYPDGVHG
jgi:Ca2+-binding RTX toxin-like protein